MVSFVRCTSLALVAPVRFLTRKKVRIERITITASSSIRVNAARRFLVAMAVPSRALVPDAIDHFDVVDYDVGRQTGLALDSHPDLQVVGGGPQALQADVLAHRDAV